MPEYDDQQQKRRRLYEGAELVARREDEVRKHRGGENEQLWAVEHVS